MLPSVCDRMENSDRTGPDWDHFHRNRITSLKKVNRIRPDWPNLPDWPDFTGFFKL